MKVQNHEQDMPLKWDSSAAPRKLLADAAFIE